jgi:NitT/TauT family transport system ATP-binding protein
MDIQLNHIGKQFNQKVAFKDISLTFLEGRINCLMGASGIGKTTIINIIMGLVKPDEGEVLGTKGKRIAAVFQEDRLIEHWNAVKNVRLVCDRDISDEEIIRKLSLVEISEDKNKPVSDFSGGMRRRVAIVRALLAKSDLVILDEPFRGLDEELKKRVISYIKQNTKGKTVIIVTHEKEDVNLLEANLIKL